MRPILSRLACNCVPTINVYVGTNGMGKKVYKTRTGKPCHMTSKVIKKKDGDKELFVRQFTLYTPPQGWAIGDVLTLNTGDQIVIDSIQGEHMLEVTGYHGNKIEV